MDAIHVLGARNETPLGEFVELVGSRIEISNEQGNALRALATAKISRFRRWLLIAPLREVGGANRSPTQGEAAKPVRLRHALC